MRQIDRLLARAGRNNELTFCECLLDGEDFSFYVKPVTMAQLSEASKPNSKGVAPTQFETAVKLFCLRALDANGNRMFQADGFMTMMRLPMDDLLAMLNAMPSTDDEEEQEVALDLKSSGEGTEERAKPSEPAVRRGKARDVAKSAA